MTDSDRQSAIFYPGSKPIEQLFAEFQADSNVSMWHLKDYTEAVAQVAMEAQKDALEALVCMPEGQGYQMPGWTIQTKRTANRGERMLVLNELGGSGTLLVMVSILEKMTPEGYLALSSAYKKQESDSPELSHFERLLAPDYGEVLDIRADEGNFEPFDLSSSVAGVAVAWCLNEDAVESTISKMLERDFHGYEVFSTRLRSRIPESCRDTDHFEYQIETDQRAHPSDMISYLRLLSDLISSTGVETHVDRSLDTMKRDGVDVILDTYKSIQALAVESVVAAGGVVDDDVQISYHKVVRSLLERDNDLTYLATIPGLLKSEGCIDPDSSYDCNDGRSVAYMVDHGGSEMRVHFETQNGKYEVQYLIGQDGLPETINCLRSIPSYKENDRRMFNYPPVERTADVGHVARFVRDENGAFKLDEHAMRTDSRALKDLIEIFHSAHTTSVCLSEDVENSSVASKTLQ